MKWIHWFADLTRNDWMDMTGEMVFRYGKIRESDKWYISVGSSPGLLNGETPKVYSDERREFMGPS